MVRGFFVADAAPAIQTRVLNMMPGAPEATAIGAMNATFDSTGQTADIPMVPILGIYAGRPLATREAVLSHFPYAEYTQIPVQWGENCWVSSGISPSEPSAPWSKRKPPEKRRRKNLPMKTKAEKMAAGGHTKRRILVRFMRYSLRVQPALLVRGSSRRIMILRFRPAHIRVINRRYLLPAATCSAFITKMAALSPDGEARPAKQIKDHQPRRLSRA
jgi:hypothetical protein